MNDLINRESAIKAIDNLTNCYNGYSDTYDKAYIIGVLEELPSAQPEQRWIPCSKRLPEVGRDRILICLSESAKHKTWFSDIGRVFEGGYSGNGFHIQSRICESGDVIAWMPLPEPAKLEDD